MTQYTVILVKPDGDYPEGIGYVEPTVHTCHVEASTEVAAVEAAKDACKPYENPIIAGVFFGHLTNLEQLYHDRVQCPDTT